MERKYKATKKAIIALCVVVALFAGLIAYLQIEMKNAKAAEADRQEEIYADKQQELADKEAEFEAAGLEDKEDALKDERDDLKKYHKALVKAYEKGEDIQPIIDEYEAVEEESEDAE